MDFDTQIRKRQAKELEAHRNKYGYLRPYWRLKYIPFRCADNLFNCSRIKRFTKRIGKRGIAYSTSEVYPCTLFGRQLVHKIVDELLYF